jgi:hypothetical protein
MQEMGEARADMRANVYSEAVPSKELVGKMSDAEKQVYTEVHASKFQNVDDQNAVAQQLGLLAPDEVIARGDFEDITTPNIITGLLADPAKGGVGKISETSKTGVRFLGALKGLLGGQTDVGYSYIRNAQKVGDINAVKIPFNRAATEADRASYAKTFRKAMKENDIPGDIISNYRTPDELELTWTGDGDPAWFRQLAKKMTGGKAVEGHNSGGLITWASEYKPSAWMEELKNPKMREKIKAMLPRIASEIEEDLASIPLTDKGRDIYQKALQIIKSGGLEAVEEAVKKNVLPSAVLGAVVLSSERASPEEPAARRGLL